MNNKSKSCILLWVHSRKHKIGFNVKAQKNTTKFKYEQLEQDRKDQTNQSKTGTMNKEVRNKDFGFKSKIATVK